MRKNSLQIYCKFIVVTLFLVVALLPGCKKDEISISTKKLVRTIYSSEDAIKGKIVDTTNYEYNTDGKLSKVIFKNGYSTYTYSSDTVTITNYGYKHIAIMIPPGIRVDSISSSMSVLSVKALILNSNGYATKSLSSDPYSPDFGLRINEYTYEYDNSGYQIKKTYSLNNQYVETSSWTNGNLTTKIITYNSGQPSSTSLYQYDIDKENKLIVPTSAFYGKTSKNLMTQKTVGQETTYTYSYELDNDGYVLKVTSVASSSLQSQSSYTTTSSWIYTYQ
jgi:hypothetical protein